MGVVFAVLAAVFVATVLLLLAGGYPVQAGLGALWFGSVGSWYALTSSTLVRAIPLMLMGSAVSIAFKAGVFNIGAEGQFLAGAATTTALVLAAPDQWMPTGVLVMLALLVAAAAGAGWASIAAILRVRFGVLEVISTIMLNFVALYAVSYLVRGPLQEPTRVYPQSQTIPDALHLARIPGAGRLHVGILIAIFLTTMAGWFFRHTAAGFRVVAVGESASAAASAGGIDVSGTMTHAFMASGALAGIAGGIEVLGVTYALYENISPGYGYTAIAVALLAGLDPWRVLATSLLFGALEAGAGAMQRDANVPSSLVSVIEALLILTVLVGQTLRTRSFAGSWLTPVARRDA
jgi:ABC-type uncharacterized transport system permease subunit